MILKQLYSYEQKRAIAKLKRNNGGICWWKLGEGKTRIALGWFADLQKQRQQSPLPLQKRFPSILLFVTRPIAFDSIREEIAKLGFDFLVIPYRKDKRQFSYAKPTVILLSHAGLSNYLHLSRMPLHMLCLDELYYFSNPKSKRSLALQNLQICKPELPIVGLGGSIMPAQDNTTIWGQSTATKLSHVLARNITAFRKQYQSCSLLSFGMQDQKVVRQFTNKPGSYDKITKRLSPYVDFHMPTNGRKRVEQIIKCDLTREQRQYIKQLKEEYYLKLEDMDFELDLSSAMSIICTVSRIANGYLLRENQTHVDIQSNKFDRLVARLDEIVEGEQSKAIVWCHFRSDLTYLSRRLSFANLQMSGGKKFDKDAWQSGRYPIVLATEAIGSSFNDFGQVPYAIYFSMSYKWLDLDQSMGRTDRRNSTHSQCHYDFLLAKGSFDETIYNTARKSGQDEQNLIITGVKQWLKESSSV